MDVKKLAGLLIASALAVAVIATAPPGTLAMMELGLIGLLYVMRRRRAAGSRRGRSTPTSWRG